MVHSFKRTLEKNKKILQLATQQICTLSMSFLHNGGTPTIANTKNRKKALVKTKGYVYVEI